MRWYGWRGRRSEVLITASEIACFAWCPEAWRLQYGLGLPAENQAALDAGTRHHARKAAAERLAGWSIRLGQVIVIAALLLLILWVLSR
jgi:hypothetical protein